METRELIKTNFRNTISMPLDAGDLFADSETWLHVTDAKSNRYLGWITSEYFRAFRYHRTTSDGQLIWVCQFLKD